MMMMMIVCIDIIIIKKHPTGKINQQERVFRD